MYAAHLVACEAFRGELEGLLSPYGTLVHERLGGSTRAKAACAAGAALGDGPPPAAAGLTGLLRSSLRASDHASLENAHAALVRALPASGPAIDRRDGATHDVAQAVLFRGLAVEVTLTFASVAVLASLSVAAREVAAAPTDTLQHVKATLFDFPTIHLERATRGDIAIKLPV